MKFAQAPFLGTAWAQKMAKFDFKMQFREKEDYSAVTGKRSFEFIVLWNGTKARANVVRILEGIVPANQCQYLSKDSVWHWHVSLCLTRRNYSDKKERTQVREKKLHSRNLQHEPIDRLCFEMEIGLWNHEVNIKCAGTQLEWTTLQLTKPSFLCCV